MHPTSKNSKLRAGMFINVSRMYHDLIKEGKLDYLKVVEYFRDQYMLNVEGFLYGTYQEDTGMESFLERVTNMYGYTSRMRKINSDGTHINCDLQMTVHIMSQLSKYDLIIIGSRNVEFIYVAQYIRAFNDKKVYFLAHNPPNILRKFGHKVIEVDERFMENNYKLLTKAQ